MKKYKDLINIILYIILPLFFITVSESLIIYFNLNTTTNSLILVSLIMILNGISMGYLAHIKPKDYNRLYLMITIIYIVIFSSLLLRNYIPMFNIFIEFIIDKVRISEYLTYSWLGLYIFNLIKYF